MRTFVYGLAVLIAAAVNVSAQTTPAKAPTAADLDRYLNLWEKKMADVQTLSALITRIDTDKVFKTATKYTGWAAYMKSGTGPTTLNKALLELKPEGKADVAEKIVATGTYVYKWEPARKEIHSYEMPRPKAGEVADSASLGLMFGMKAAVAKERFNLTLAKEDQHYVYVDVTPKRAEDKAEFQRARLVLHNDTFLPRQVWLEQPNGNEVTWDLPRTVAGVRIDPRYFDTPRPPAGWKLVPVNRTAPGTPRVIRGESRP